MRLISSVLDESAAPDSSSGFWLVSSSLYVASCLTKAAASVIFSFVGLVAGLAAGELRLEPGLDEECGTPDAKVFKGAGRVSSSMIAALL